jgi:4-hydroxyphenylacetate 3-monooxygenase oxygenase component
MPARTGKQYLDGLRPPRNVWVDGARVDNIVEHPALAGAAQALADVYDLQRADPDTCLIPDPETGEPISMGHMISASRDDLARRHKCLEKIADFSVGLMGRTPDYLNVTFAGFAGDADLWAQHGNEAGAEALVAYQKQMRREDLSLTHAIVPPTVDKAQGDTPRPGDPIQLRKIEDTEHGIVVSGGRALATLAPFADDMAIYPRAPFPEGSEEFALSFSVPMTTPGLTILCRDSMAAETNRFDHPLSSRFDEQDAFVIFDRVEIPRDRVFIDGNLPVYNSVMQGSWLPNITHQTMIRATVKLEFAWGLVRRMAETLNAKDPTTQQMIGEIWCYKEFTRSAVVAAEAEAHEHVDGFWIPDVKPLFALRAMLPLWFPRVNEIIQLIGAHYMLAAPRSAQFGDPELRGLIDTYLSGALDVGSKERASLFRLAWDFVGSEMGGRNLQYERFYLASSPRNMQRAPSVDDATRSALLVERFIREALEDCAE